MTAQSLFEKFGRILNDEDHTRWPQAEFLGWLSSARRKLAEVRPDALSESVDVPLVEGTKQRISGTSFLKATRNVGGMAVSFIPKDALDLYVPQWPTLPEDKRVRFYTNDTLDPKTFYVIPGQPQGTNQKLEVLQVRSLEEFDSLNDSIDVESTYENTLLLWTLHLALSKESDSPGMIEVSERYRRAFFEEIEFKTRIDAAAVQEG